MSRDGRRVTVAIPTRGRPEGLCTVVTDLWAGTRRPEEILVVSQDEAPEDTARRLREAVPGAIPVVRFYASTRRGTNANRNDCLRLASGDFIAFTDDDVRLPPDWLESMLQAWLDGWEAGDVLLTGPILPPPDTPDPATTPGCRTGEERRVWRTPPAVGDVLYGEQFGAPRPVFAKAGKPPFDERFGPGAPFAGAGDEEFAIRVLAAGVPVAFEPTVAATHLADPKDWVRSHWRHAQGSGAMYVLRWRAGERGVLGSAARTVAGIVAKGLRAAASLRPLLAAGRFAGATGIIYGAIRWWVAAPPAEARAPEPAAGALREIPFD